MGAILSHSLEDFNSHKGLFMSTKKSLTQAKVQPSQAATQLAADIKAANSSSVIPGAADGITNLGNVSSPQVPVNLSIDLSEKFQIRDLQTKVFTLSQQSRELFQRAQTAEKNMNDFISRIAQ